MLDVRWMERTDIIRCKFGNVGYQAKTTGTQNLNFQSVKQVGFKQNSDISSVAYKARSFEYIALLAKSDMYPSESLTLK